MFLTVLYPQMNLLFSDMHTCPPHYVLKPWFHVQLLHAVIYIRTWAGLSRSISVCDVTSKMKNYCYYQPLREQRRFHW